MAEPRWLTDEEAQAWRRFTTMRFQLDARLDRQLGNTISIQDYGVLASLSEEPNKSMRISELGDLIARQYAALKVDRILYKPVFPSTLRRILAELFPLSARAAA